MRFLATFILFFCLISEGISQKTLSDYSFVIVPEKFDFVNEKDKYQLNSLTKFLFNKHGFNAYFDSDRPNMKRCDGLYAEVIGKPAIIRTKVTVVLRDCYGDEVYRSEVGKSKLKAYNKTYTAALRQAFLSIGDLGVQQNDPEIFGDSEDLDNRDTSPGMDESQSLTDTNPVNSEENTTTTIVEEVVDKTSVVEAVTRTMYSHGGLNFGLLPTKAGYKLVEKTESGETLKGRLLLKKDNSLEFIDPAGNKFPAHFDSEENLIILTSFQRLEFIKQNQ